MHLVGHAIMVNVEGGQAQGPIHRQEHGDGRALMPGMQMPIACRFVKLQPERCLEHCLVMQRIGSGAGMVGHVIRHMCTRCS